jgi:hypothetical protein
MKNKTSKPKQPLSKTDVNGSLLESIRQDLLGLQQNEPVTPDVKSGLGIAIELIERYMCGDLGVRKQ